MANNKGLSKIPSIRGQIAERLQQAEERFDETEEDEMEFPEGPGEITLMGAEERGVVALACLILENLREVGGTRAPKKPLESVVRKALATFDRKEVMEIEVEAYEILLWIGHAIDPSWSPDIDEVPEADEITPESSNLELIRWAIAEQADLVLDYYSHGRGELTHRQVTPISLEAETYLHGYCHLRQDDRVFRIQRIADLKPAAEDAPWKTDRTPADDPPKRPQPPVEQRQPPAGEAQRNETADDESSDGEEAEDQISLVSGPTRDKPLEQEDAESEGGRRGPDETEATPASGSSDESANGQSDDDQLSLLDG